MPFQKCTKPFWDWLRLRWAKWAGRMSWDSMMLNTSATMTTTPMVPKKLPMPPSTSTKGRNAATVVSTPKITGMETSQVPSMAAWVGDLPICSWVWMRSPTTMASSTRMPSTRMKAITVRVLMLMSM